HRFGVGCRSEPGWDRQQRRVTGGVEGRRRSCHPGGGSQPSERRAGLPTAMTAVAWCSAKGSPGVTTAVQLVAGAWPAGRPLLIVEADPAGGDLAARLGL